LIIAHDDYIIHELHPGNLKPGPLLAAGNFVMGLFQKKWEAKRQMGPAKGNWGAERQM
jgi:hypothetical protein